MAKTVPLDGPALVYAREVFRRYYASARIPPPPRFARREFAAFPFARESLMRRHASFRSAEEFRAYFPREVPRHVYYSSAYYREPDHPKMEQKEWLGADLIFDLDADHLRGAESLGYVAQLARVKERTQSLLDDFLFGDFGIDPRETTLAFSGGRGYHVHVHDERFLSLTSPERRELVEYVLGAGFDPSTAIVSRRDDGAGATSEGQASGGGPDGPTGRGSHRARVFRALPSPAAPGWAGRTTRAVLKLLERWQLEGPKVATAELEASGVPPARARVLAHQLLKEGVADQIRGSLSLEVFPRGLPGEFLTHVLARAAIEVQGETDAPVTTDIHRLIRLPESLHGGTGFRVVPLAFDALAAFDPFADAVVADSGATVRIRLNGPVDYPFQPGRVVGDAGATLELPDAPAVFLVMRGEAELLPSPGP
ncbi:MAG: DNA primase small subunit domain-containing protein [Candidatus Lutacidiplasmatales archaeon]